MQNKTLLIKNGYLVNSKNILKADIFISNGKILKIGDLSSIKSEITIDASNNTHADALCILQLNQNQFAQ